MIMHIFLGVLATGGGWKYSGGIVGQYTKHGGGQQIWSDAAEYTGKYKDGKISGPDGLFRWPTGETYLGDWADNKMEGKGVFTYVSGATYEGDFIGTCWMLPPAPFNKHARRGQRFNAAHKI